MQTVLAKIVADKAIWVEAPEPAPRLFSSAKRPRHQKA